MRGLASQLCLLLSVTLALTAGGASAQQVTQPTQGPPRSELAARFDANAKVAEDILRAPPRQYSEQRLAYLNDVRNKLAADREAAGDLADRGSTGVRILQAQVEALGPVPTEGKTEPPAVTARRAQLNEQLGSLMTPLMGDREAAVRAETLVKDLDERIRLQKRRELLERGHSPVDPLAWGGALEDAGAGVAQFSSTARQRIADSGFGRIAGEVLGGVALLLVTAWAARGLFRLVSGLVNRWAGANASVARTMLFTLLQDVLAGLTVFVIAIVITLAATLLLAPGLSADQLVQVWVALLIAAAPFAVGDWVARSALNSPFPELRLVVLPPDKIAGGLSIIRQIAGLVAAELAVNALEYANLIGISLSRILSALLVIAGGYLVWRLAGMLRSARRYAKAQHALMDDAGEPGANRQAMDFATPISRILRLFAIVAVGAALVGYVMLSRQVLTATLLTLAILAAAVYLDRTIALVSRAAADGPLRSYRRPLHFLPLAAGLLLTLALIPVVAVVWGYSPNEIGDAIVLLRKGVNFGDVKLSIGDVFTFAIIFFLGFLATRTLQRFLKVAVLPELKVDPGAQSAIVTGLGYIGIILAAVVAIAATGLDLSSLAFVAGALSVGLGFGLQAVVENFTSGILLLIERPIKDGDWIEVGEHSGIVRKIAVRSTHIETFDGHRIIIPNSKLIKESVKNRSFSGGPTRIVVKVGVAYGTDLEKAKALLLDVAGRHDFIVDEPAPSVSMEGFGDSSIDLKLFGFVADATKSAGIESDLMLDIAQTFGSEGVEIPFPQRDLHVKAWPAAASEA